MNSLIRVKNYNGEVRRTLCSSDVIIDHKEVLLELGAIEEKEWFGEKVLVFHSGFRVPYLQVFYGSRIKSTGDKYLPELIKRLLFMNPNPDKLGVRKIVECILRYFTATVTRDSQIKPGEVISVPILSFESVEIAVKSVLNSGVMASYVPNTERYVMYKCDSSLTRSQKISVSAQVRAIKTTEYYEKAIHNAAEYLNEAGGLLKVNNSRLQGTELITNNKGKSISVKTISRYISKRTQEFIEEMNRTRPFKGQISLDKYNEFLTLDLMPAENSAKILGVSKSTVLEYRKIEKNLEEQEKLNLI